MNRFLLWQQFLRKQETTAGNVFVLATLAIVFWWLCVRGHHRERWANVLAIGLFWAVTITLGVLGW